MYFFGIFSFMEAAGYSLAKYASHSLKAHVISYLLKKTEFSNIFHDGEIQDFMRLVIFSPKK